MCKVRGWPHSNNNLDWTFLHFDCLLNISFIFKKHRKVDKETIYKK